MTGRWAAVAAAAVYVVITAVLGRDVLASLGSAIASDEGDPLLTSAILYWNATRLPYSEAWWQFPVAYPTRDTLAFSEHLLGLSPIATPIYWVTRDAIVTYNLVTLLTFPLCALAMYALVYRLTHSAAGAFLAGLAFAFSPYRISQLPHVQMLAFFWAPLALLGLHAYVETGKRRWLALYAAAWMLQGAANGYALVFFSAIVGLWVLWFVVARRNGRALGMIGSATIIASIPLVPIVTKYMAVHALHGFTRDPAEIRAYSADLLAVFCAPGQLTFWGWIRTACRPEGELFPGVALVVLGLLALIRVVARPSGGTESSRSRAITVLSAGLLAIGLVYAGIASSVAIGGPWSFEIGPVRVSASSLAKPVMVATAALGLALVLSPGIRRAARGSSTLGFYLVAALLSWALALGPTVTFMGEPRGFPAPFALLTYLPGIEGLRVPARFWLTASMCLAVVVGLVAAAWFEGRHWRFTPTPGSQLPTPNSRRPRGSVRAAGLVLAACALLADGWIERIRVARVPAPVPDARLLRDATVLTLPMGSLRDIAAQFLATTGGWRSVNAYSGYLPNYYPALSDAARAEDEAAIVPFLGLGDLHVIVARDAPRLTALVERQPGAVVMAASPGAIHYRVPRRSTLLRAGDLGQRLPVRAVSASCETANAALVADGDETTRWECGPQRPGHEIVIDLGHEAPVGAVVQNLGHYTTNFPRHLVIDTSVDGIAWEPAWDGSVRGLLIAQAMERPSPSVRFAVPFARRPARYLRLRQTAADQDLPWSVAEIEVY